MLALLLATVALAPSLSVSGHTLHWTGSSTASYKVNAKASDGTAANTPVEGTSYAPPAQPGLTVSYRVKVRGEKVWSNTVTIAWPTEEKTQPPGTLKGINAGTETLDLTGADTLRAKVVRIHFSASEPGVSWLPEWNQRYAEHGVKLQPVVTFDGHMLSAQEAKGLVSLDRLPGLEDVELGNETSYGYQYGDGYTAASYKERARVYAVRVREAAEVLNPHGIGVLAQAEDGGSGSNTWVKEMFASVPNLSRYVAAWVIHPYTNQRTAAQSDTQGVPKMERMVAQLAEVGDTTTPIAITEWGVSSDEGRTLDNGASLTSSEAAKIAETTVPRLLAATGRHPVQSFLLYQVRDQAPHGESTSREMYFGALTRSDGSKGPFTTAIQKLLAG